MRSPLSETAIAIWKAGVAAVDSQQLVKRCIHRQANSLHVADSKFDLTKARRIEIIGAGKAGAGMVRGCLDALASVQLPTSISVGGWVNVPADCVPNSDNISSNSPSVTLHPARPPGINQPTVAGVFGTKQILERLKKLDTRDICIVLISGGGSALLPAPAAGISLDDKLQVTQQMAAAGAPIEHLNIVRRNLSAVKGGRLLKACKSTNVVCLIISDIIGDPLGLIASGPTVRTLSDPAQAWSLLTKHVHDDQIPQSVRHFLTSATAESVGSGGECNNVLLGSNQIALAAAAKEADRRGYRVADLGSANCGTANEHGRWLFQQIQQLHLERNQNVCVLAGGETTVQLAQTEQPQKGGRNQQAILAAIEAFPTPQSWRQRVLLSGGTDGEDGPTDAAGAFADQQVVAKMIDLGLKPHEFLAVNNSYPFFEQTNGLLKTGPSHTNVMDLAVGLFQKNSAK